MSHKTINSTPGFYGKVPAKGDFVTRNLAKDFIEKWDQWLQKAIAESRLQLDKQWQNYYLSSPLWRFCLAPGICAKQAYAGILMPSVDRVGRYFPMVIAVPVEYQGNDLQQLFIDAYDWFEQAEQVALDSLADNLDLAQFTQQVSLLNSPELQTPIKLQPANKLSTSTDHYFPLEQLNQLNNIPLQGKNNSIWCTHGSKLISPCLLSVQGLPKVEKFSAMLTGEWEKFSWL